MSVRLKVRAAQPVDDFVFGDRPVQRRRRLLLRDQHLSRGDGSGAAGRRCRGDVLNRQPGSRRRHLQARRRGPQARRLPLRLPPAALHVPREVTHARRRHLPAAAPVERFRRTVRFTHSQLKIRAGRLVVTTSTSSQSAGAARRPRSRAAGWTASARAVSGLTPSAKALYVAGTAQARCRTASCCTSCRATATSRRRAPTSSFFLAALEGLSAGRRRARGAAVSLARGRSLSRTGAAHRRDVGARARAARHRHAAPRASSSRRRPRCCRASARPSGCWRASLELKPGQDIAPTDLAELLVDAGFTREDPADEHGEFAVRGGIVDIFPAGEAQPVRLEFIGDTIETLRTYDPATQRSIAPIDQVAIVPLRDVLDDESTRDALRLPGARGKSRSDHRVRARRGRSARGQAARAAAAELRRAIVSAPAAPAVSRLPPSELFAEPGSRSNRGWPAPRSWRCSASTLAAPASRRRGRCSAHPVPAGGGAERPRRRLGRRDSPAAATRARRRCSSRRRTGRAERTIELLKEYDVFAVPVERAEDARYAAVLVAIGSLSRGFRLPDAGLQIYAEADVFEEERRAPERRRSATKAFLSDLRDLKVGDLVVHVDHGIGMFVGLKQIGVGDSDAGVPRAALRRRGQAVRAGRTARSRPEIHRRDAGRRSIGSAARRGSARRPRSRRRCATWPRSCSSSTPRARRCRATPSAPTRTGSRSSRTRSSTS